MSLKNSSAMCFLWKWVSKSETQGEVEFSMIYDGAAMEALEINFHLSFAFKAKWVSDYHVETFIHKCWLMLCACLCPNGQTAHRTVILNLCVFSWLTSLLFTGAIMHRLLKLFSDWSRFEMLPREMHCKQHQSKGRWGRLSGESEEN